MNNRKISDHNKIYKHKLSNIPPNYNSITLEWDDEFDGQVYRWSGPNARAFCYFAVEKYNRKGYSYNYATKRKSYAYRTMSEWINDKNIFSKISDYILNWAKRFSVEGVYSSNDEYEEDEDWEWDDE